LGATIWGFARITVGQIFLAAIIGSKHVSRLEQTPLWHANLFPLVLLIVFLAITVVAFRKGPPAYRVFTVFAVLIYASALWSPVISTTQPQWDALEVPGAGRRPPPRHPPRRASAHPALGDRRADGLGISARTRNAFRRGGGTIRHGAGGDEDDLSGGAGSECMAVFSNEKVKESSYFFEKK
jgi:hypothetical protein